MQQAPAIETVWRILETVKDPEVPVLSILDLGIVRGVEWKEDTLSITITPTYSGCPAMDVIAIQIRLALAEAGYPKVQLQQSLSPAWTTDWMTESGKEKLRAFGIAPPQYKVAGQAAKGLFDEEQPIPCPHCGSHHTHRVSEFGSTACKALHQCDDCKEPFDYFKCH